jgi:hypothetical protein
VAITATNFGRLITSLYCFGLFLGTIYSVPPFRLKRSAIAAFMIIATGELRQCWFGFRLAVCCGSTASAAHSVTALRVMAERPTRRTPCTSCVALLTESPFVLVACIPFADPCFLPVPLMLAVRGFLLNFGVYHAARAALGLPFVWNPSIT